MQLRRKHPEMKRPYKIPGGIAMGFFASAVASGAFVFMFVPASPFYIGNLAVRMFLIWMAIGFTLFALCGAQRKKLSKAEIEHNIFGTTSVEK